MSGVPLAIESLCLRCLAKDADARPTAAELYRLAATDPLPPTDPYIMPDPRRPRRPVLIGGAVLALLFSAGLAGWRLRPAPLPVTEVRPGPTPSFSNR